MLLLHSFRTMLIGILVIFFINTLFSQQDSIERIKWSTWKGKDNIGYVQGEILVVIKSINDTSRLHDLVAVLPGAFVSPFDKLGICKITVPDSVDIFPIIEALNRNPWLKGAEPNLVGNSGLLPNDPFFQGTLPATYPYQWALLNTGQDPPLGKPGADIHITQAWDIWKGTNNDILAILDTGIPLDNNGNLNHPDLGLNNSSRFILGPDYTIETDGIIDIVGHGSHVTGIAAAVTDNGIGIAGVAWNCKVLVVQATRANSIPDNARVEWFKSGLIYAVDNGAKVINYSAGWFTSSLVAEEALAYALSHDVVIVTIAHNDGGPLRWPAVYSSTYSNVIAVGATNHNDVKPGYSNTGPELDVVAPGGAGSRGGPDDVTSTVPIEMTTFLGLIIPGYARGHGTSLAAPHVTGLVSMLRSYPPFQSYTASQIRDRIRQSADDVNGETQLGRDNDIGYGRINAYRAFSGAPAFPILSSPANGSITNSLEVHFQWNAATWATRYYFQIDDEPTFSAPLVFQVNSTTSTNWYYTLPSPDVTYYWRVAGIATTNTYNGQYLQGEWSSTRSFTTPESLPDPPPGGGGCPFVYSWSGEKFEEDNNILPQSEYRGNENKNVTDYYRLLKAPVEKEGTYSIELREFENEHSYIDEVELIAIDHPAENEIAVLDDGSIVQYTTPFKTMVNLPDVSAIVSWRISAMDDTTYKASPGKSLELVFISEKGFEFTSSSNEGGIVLGGLTLHGKYLVGLPKKQSVGSVGIGRNFVGKKASFGFRERNTLVYVPLERLDQTLTLNFAEYVALDVAKLALKVPSTYEQQSLRLLSAAHKTSGDVTYQLSHTDGTKGELEPGQSLQLQFEATPVAQDMKRSFILKSHGRYEKLVDTDKSFPTEYALYQNYPNPFNPVTTFY